MDPVRSARWIARLTIPLVAAAMIGTVAWWVQSRALPIVPEGAHVAVEQTIENIQSISIEGAWKVMILQGSEPSVHGNNLPARARDSWMDISGTALELKGLDGVSRPEAVITVPTFKELSIDGTATVLIENFGLQELNIEINGSANVEGPGSTIELLVLQVDGAGKIDFTESRITNAQLDIDGAGKVDLTMDGGVLEGRLDGVGQVTYSGDVESEDIVVRGLGDVRRR